MGPEKLILEVLGSKIGNLLIFGLGGGVSGRVGVIKSSGNVEGVEVCLRFCHCAGWLPKLLL